MDSSVTLEAATYGPACLVGSRPTSSSGPASRSSSPRHDRGRRVTTPDLDAIVIGAGPNGLAAALTLARAGRSVRVYEAAATIGGGTRTQEPTLPGFRHDICSTILPLTVASPFFRTIDWDAHGVEFVHPDAPLSHPLDGGRAAVLERSRRRPPPGWTPTGGAMTGGPGCDCSGRWFGTPPSCRGAPAARSSTSRATRWRSRGSACRHCGPPRAWRGAGSAGSGPGPVRRSGGAFDPALDRPLTCLVRAGPRDVRACRGLADGPRRSAGRRRRAGRGTPVARRRDRHGPADRRPGRLPPSRVCSSTRHRAPSWPSPATGCRRAPAGVLERFRYGPGVFKVDWALDGPIRGPRGRERAATVHLGGTLDEIARRSGRSPPAGIRSGRSCCSPSTTRGIRRARPPGKTTAWAYCHVPDGSDVDMTERIEAQVERFAPGLPRPDPGPRHGRRPRSRPTTRTTSAATSTAASRTSASSSSGPARPRSVPPRRRVFLCSSSTPPGGGVHGMCGFLAARSALGREFR